ncbi:FAD-dependent oxidoreductase [Sulfurimonas sp. C5]|uniref:NAD(P)/FAD-dependent oxidoreductase n=1 Tax=Sulfurimonas sp. C5 TaxID=3036947 RepID=UPI002455E97C|nr:FAD-dependent oxidoreductase [Sulfurimonas sp. C5]MDH4943789.1 FAD-dependent oxidoreductase [Sulfurimonas sp. C5]
MYDIAIVGAGINGCLVAYQLKLLGQNVIVFDKEGIAAGGSGAAGAFLSPKFAKNGELKELLNSSLDIALDFYTTHFSKHVQHYNLLHIAKDEKDADHLRFCKENDNLELLDNPPFIPEDEYIYTSKSAIVDAQSICNALLEDIEYQTESIDTLEYLQGYWLLNKHYKAKKVLLATGAYEHNFYEQPYKNIRGIWGHRIDVSTSTKNDISIHQFVSISPVKDKKLAIGATHNVHYHPQTSNEPYNYEAGRLELLEKANRTLELQDVQVLKDYVGLRSGSVDYMPLVGQIVDVKSSLGKLTRREIEQKKPDFSKLVYHNELYMINGSAGYGYVLAPYLAITLAKAIVQNEEIPLELLPARFFYRWAKNNKTT